MRTRDIVTLPQRIYTKLIEVDHAAHAWQCISHVRLCACEPIKRHILLHLPCCPPRWPTRCTASSEAEPPARRGVADGSVADVLQRDRAPRAMCAAAAWRRLRTVATLTRAARACGWGVGRHVSSICCSSSSGESSGGCSEAAAAAAASGAGAVRVGGVGRHGRGAAGARALPGWARRGRLHARRLLPKLPLRPPSPPPWPPPAPPGDRTWLT
jgi:hypothetical protein